MHVKLPIYRFFIASLFCVLVACGGGGEANPPAAPAPPPVVPPPLPPPPPPAGTLVGAAGGTVMGPNGSSVVIPAGALANEVRINIEQVTAGALALPAGYTAYGPMFAFTPHGTTFAVPVTMTLPFDPAAVPAGTAPTFYKTTNAQSQWQQVADATFGANTVTAEVTSFSDATVVIPPLTAGVPLRVWSFREFRGDSLEEFEVATGTQSGGVVNETRDFGGAVFDSAYQYVDGTIVPADGRANGDLGSLESGYTYWVGAEAPLGNAAPKSNDVIGSKTRLVQYQTFIKNTASASYTFKITSAFLDVYDGNAILFRPCPRGHGGTGTPCDLIKAEIFLDVKAYSANTPPHTVFFRTAGTASINGSAPKWDVLAWSESYASTPLWLFVNNFDLARIDFNGPNGNLWLNLRAPIEKTVDLSSIAVGERFTVRVVAHAYTYNRAAGSVSGKGAEFETAANAWLRDPITIGGTSVTTFGLTLVDTPTTDDEPLDLPVSPAPCAPGPGPDPAAGELQFSSASYFHAESGTTPSITVIRTGGTSGAVTATFTTTDGTGVANVDYAPVNSSVFFADGDAEPRLVTVSAVQDVVHSEPDKTVNLALSEPGGCAALGAQTTATLTIRDDDLIPPPPPLPSGLDTTFGSDGKASLAAFGGDRSAMALQADGKIVMAGGTFTDFVLARFLADGRIDTGFGNAGKVTSNIVSGEQEEALAVAIQPDGKILVAGYTGQAVGPSVIALARYLATGEPDTTFGAGGEVVSPVIGRAFALALDTSGPEIKILVAGDDPAAEDMVVARFNSTGTLDTSFDDDGRLTVNVAGAGDIASNIALLANDGIMLSGGSSTGLVSTSLAKLDANGVLDASFGSGGKLVLSRQVGEGLALQDDGKIVLAGKIETLVPPATQTLFEVMRLNANGTPDSSFGTAGIVDTAVSTLGDAAYTVTLQPDGKIVAAGAGSMQVNANFAVVRYDTNGVLDPAFGNGTGMLTVDFFGSTDAAESVAVQPDGKIVAGGLARDSVDGYGVIRINP